MNTSFKILSVLILCLGGNLFGQNLVPNPSFETYNACPNSLGAVSNSQTIFTSLTNWTNPTAGSPDYFNSCASFLSGAGVPNNSFGYHTARSGNGYAGICVVFGNVNNNDYREYIENKLSTPLIAGHRYYVRFYASLTSPPSYSASHTIVTIDRLAMHFSGTYVRSSGILLGLSPDIIQPGNYITDMMNWVQVTGLYNATGGENYIVIGHFKDTVSTPHLQPVAAITQHSDSMCYLYIDDVCIKDLASPDFVNSRDTAICGTALPLTLTPPNDTASKYLWNTGDTSSSIQAPAFGKYWRATLGDCMITIDTINVHPPDTIITTFTLHPPCYNQGNGYILVNATNGLAPYRFALGTGSFDTNDSFSNLTPGNYAIHITDSMACVIDATVTLSAPTALQASIGIQDPLCYRDSTGSITITPSGGTLPYKYAIDTGGYTINYIFNNLNAGAFAIHVKDGNDCIKDTIVTVVSPPQLKLTSILVRNLNCFNDSSGSVRLQVSGGTMPYSFTDSGGISQHSDTLTGLKAGNNLIVIRDVNGCFIDTNIQLTQPPQLFIKIDSIKNPICEGDENGYLQLSANGGSPTYAYSVNDPAHYFTINTFSTLAAGTYTAYVRDGHKCMADTTVILTGPHIAITNVQLNNASCFDGIDGAISLTATGSSSISYLLNETVFNNSGQFDHLRSQQYNVAIAYGSNCRKDTFFTITQPDALTAIITTTTTDCEWLYNIGTASVAVSGGVAPYTYQWQTADKQTTQNLTGLLSGNYMVLIRDANNCPDSAIAVINYDNCCKPWLPNAFTPNADGKDDLFRLKYKGDMKLDQFYIYDRFGKRVFNTVDLQAGWDGTLNGTPQDMGTYFYFIKARCGNTPGHEITLKGDVLLVR